MKNKKKIKLKNLIEQIPDEEDEDDELEDVPKPSGDEPEELKQKEKEDDIDIDDEEKPKKSRVSPEEKGKLANLKDAPLREITIGKKVIKDVKIDSVVIKEEKPWILEVQIEMNLQPTLDYKAQFIPMPDESKLTPQQRQSIDFSKFKKQFYEDYFSGFRDTILKRFGTRAIYDVSNKIKENLDNELKGKYPVLKWDHIPVSFYEGKGIRERIRPGNEMKNISVGYYLRFVVPKEIQTDKDINRLLAYKIDLFKEKLANSKTFTEDNYFKIKPYKG